MRGGIPKGSFVWRPWWLFDPFLSPRELVVSGALVHERPTRGGDHGGFALAVGPSIETRRGALIFRGQVQYGLRRTGDSHLVLELFRYGYAVGVALGPIELDARIGLGLSDIHFGAGGFGLGFLSPRVGVGAAIKAGGLRVGLLAFRDYAPRWTAGPDARIEGFLLDIALGSPPKGLPPRFRLEGTPPPSREAGQEAH